jgi:hypothetical protein
VPSCDPLVVIQQTAKPGTPTDPTLGLIKSVTLDQPILEPLMIPLATVVIDEFFEGPSEVALTEWHDPIEALVFNRPHEPFSMGVCIGRLKWRLHDVHARIAQLASHIPAPFPVTIADQRTMIAEQAIRCD